MARCQRGRWSQSLANNKLAAVVSQPAASPTSNISTGVLISSSRAEGVAHQQMPAFPTAEKNAAQLPTNTTYHSHTYSLLQILQCRRHQRTPGNFANQGSSKHVDGFFHFNRKRLSTYSGLELLRVFFIRLKF